MGVYKKRVDEVEARKFTGKDANEIFQCGTDIANWIGDTFHFREDNDPGTSWVEIGLMQLKLGQYVVKAEPGSNLSISILSEEEYHRDYYESSNLEVHARRELEIIGEDPETIEGIVGIVRAFAAMGHSGGSADPTLELLYTLLKFRPLTELTDDPSEWVHHDATVWGVEGGIWQSVRNPEAFSEDGGKTFYLLSDRPKARESRPAKKETPAPETEPVVLDGGDPEDKEPKKNGVPGPKAG